MTADAFQTPLKSRILSGGDNTKKQQILRIDTLPPVPAGERARLKLVKALFAALAESDLLVLSDYLARPSSRRSFKPSKKIPRKTERRGFAQPPAGFSRRDTGHSQ